MGLFIIYPWIYASMIDGLYHRKTMKVRGENLMAKVCLFRKYISSDSGAILPIAALAFPLLLGVAGLGVDAGNWMMQKRTLQTAADAAAIAGGWELANEGTDTDVEYAALKEAELNGYDPALAGASLNITVTETADGVPNVQVDIVQSVDVWFSSIFLDNDIMAATTATSEIEEPDSTFCILSLDQEMSRAISVSGNVTIDSPNCGIANNSSADDALYLNGSVIVGIGQVKITGDYEIVGGSVEFNYSSLRTNASRTNDPYEDLEVPEFNGCTNGQMNSGTTRVNSSGTVTLDPGTFCGGISVTGTNDIVLNPGVYIMDGGDFSVSGGGSISGDGVTIILTNSGGDSYGSYGNLDISGNKEVYLSAPDEGEEWAGIVAYQDRNAPEGGSSGYNKITGTSGVEIDGAVYMPSRRLDYGGDAVVDSPNGSPCSQVIAKQVVLHGNPTLGNDCDGKGTEPIGDPSVRLIN